MMKILSLSNEIFGFDIPNSDKAVILGEVEETGYDAVEELNAKLRQKCEERALCDQKAEAVAASIFAGC